MKRLLIFCLLLSFGILTVFAQRQKADSISTNAGMLRIYPVSHASLVLSWNNKTIYVDPVGGKQLYQNNPPSDIILITDIHGDHLDFNTVNQIKQTRTKVIAPRAVADSLRSKGLLDVIIMNNGENRTEDGIIFHAIPMYNLPEKDSRHPKGRGNGYLLEMGGKRIYISGDTEDISEMRQLKNIDVAFICMNLPYTMDIYQATSAVLEFKPAIVYPYHYRGQNGMSDVETFKLLVTKENSNIDVRLLNWYPEK